jgi:hypothetical protein
VSVYEKLQELDITLPELTAPVAVFLPFVRAGNLLFLSGHIAKTDGKPHPGSNSGSLFSSRIQNRLSSRTDYVVPPMTLLRRWRSA